MRWPDSLPPLPAPAAPPPPPCAPLPQDSGGHYAFSPVAVNLLVESFKTLFALGTLVAYVGAL